MGLKRGILMVALVCAAVGSARAMTEEEERAKAHFLAGQSYYEQASYTDALREFNEAYRISKRPALLYNIARCFEALEQYGEAVQMLERYLDEVPTTPDRLAIETRIAHLKERSAAAATRRKPRLPSEPTEPAKPPPPAPRPPPPAPPPPKRVWTWVVGGVGLAALAAAAGTGIASQLTYNSLNSDCTNGSCLTVANAQERIDRGKRLALATDVLWPIGVAAVATSVVLFFVEGRRAPSHARVAPFFAPSTGGVVVALDF